MKKILTILAIITLTLTAAAQTGRQMKVYIKGGLVDCVPMGGDMSIGHSRADLNGVVHDDYVSMVVKDAEGRERQYLISQLDSLVMPNGRRVVFRGYTSLTPSPSPVGRGAKRSSFSGTFPGQGTGNVTFKWTEYDRIRLDVGYESRAEQLSADGTSASFVFDGADDLTAERYQVYFPDRSVTIKSVQTQRGADNTLHIYESGDCGTATATQSPLPTQGGDGGGSERSYSFTLEHKSAYICFLPHIDHLPSAKLTKITLTCSAAIAGNYELSGSGLYNGTSTSNVITLNLVPQRPSDFFIGHDALTEQDSCAAYMVIAPQSSSQTFTATYYITDTLSHISKLYRQTFSFQPVANTVYPVTCHILDEEFRTIDLGLSCNWSNVNVGATEPSRAGSTFTSDADANAALLAQTVVTQWLMPDDDQKDEILEKCSWTAGTYNAQPGYFVEGAAVAKEYGERLRIFLPCSVGTTKQQCLAQNWRPVEALMVDLGLSSGTKWAARNIGATSIEDYGNYYAWGEVETKESYTSGNYKWGSQNLGNNFDISGTQNDVASVIWGGIWRMPTYTDMLELMDGDNCQWTWSSINGVNGYIIQGTNGNKIFLPAAGFMKNGSSSYATTGGSYATSTQGGDRSDFAYTLGWWINRDGGVRSLPGDNTWYPFENWDDTAARKWGRTVRAVAAPNAVAPDGMALNIVTDSASWKLGGTSATLYGTLSSTSPIKGSVNVGFVVGDSATIVKSNCRFEYEQTVSVAGAFSQVQLVYDNIGYWYRAYVATGDTVFYGAARHYGYEMVDLGLSVKWANMNLGANAPEDFGNYYAWGETAVKSDYSSATYAYSTTQNLGEDLNIGETDNDAVHVHMGNAWRMPTRTEMSELTNTDNCSWTWTSQNNVNGYKVTSLKNGNSIFLPAAGFKKNGGTVYATTGGSYATSTQGGDRSSYAYTLGWWINRDGGARSMPADNAWYPFENWDDTSARWYGRSIRAVAVPNGMGLDGVVLNIRTDSAIWKWGDDKAMLYGTLSSTTPLVNSVNVGFVIGDNDSVKVDNARFRYTKEVTEAGRFSYQQDVYDNIGYWCRAYVETADTIFYGKARHYGLEMVDLGLGVLWANMNVGASRPEEYGDYYAWGETSTKNEYSSNTYMYGSKNLGDNFDIAGTEHDVAHVRMGNAWRMPTNTEMQNLIDNCTWKWTSQDNVNGYRVTGPNGNSIFLPAAGYVKGAGLQNASLWGSYATSTQSGDRDSHSYTLGWNINTDGGARYLRSDNTWHPFSDWGDVANRCYGRSVRAVATPSVIAPEGMALNVLTDSAKWNLDGTSAIVYGTLSSTMPLLSGTKVGFVVGDSAKIEKHNANVYTLTTDANGRFSTDVSVANNMGYWYRAYVELPNGGVFYGAAKHFGWEAVDLGLTSKTLWCNMNIGCTWPEDYGNYYAWGEIESKVDYSSGTYLYGTQNLGNNYDISGTALDAAHEKMVGDWCMPTNTEMQELMDECTWRWTSRNDVNGYVVTGPNDRSIFLPAAGYMKGTGLQGGSLWGSYATSVQTGNGDSHTYTMDWNINTDGGARYLRSDNTYHPFSDWGDAANRCYGRSVRAVAVQKAQRP